MIYDHQLHYRVNLLFGTLDIPDGMRAIGLLSGKEYDRRVENTILATRGDFSALANAFRDLAKITRFKELNSQKDTLTGVFNRAFYNEMLADQIKLVGEMEAPTQRENIPVTRGVAVCTVDMDHFKRINDQYGHLAGDRALRIVSSVMTENVRANDIVARTGGDEFSIILKNVTAEEAEEILQKLQKKFDEMAFEYPDGEKDVNIDLNASIGMTMIKLNQEADLIIDNSDKDMISRKNARKVANPALRHDRN